MNAKLIQFKRDVESITHDDVVALRERKTKHAIDLETLEISLALGDQYVAVMQDFLESIGFATDRIEAVECRRRDGFIPYAHNNGGMEAFCYRDQYSCCQHTRFEKTDEVLEKYAKYAADQFREENPALNGVPYSDWESEDQERLQEYELEYAGEDTVQFQARVMMTSATTANVDFYVSASDSPYHRTSDDKLELEIEFKTPAGMKRKLASILKHDFVSKLKTNTREGF